MKRPRKRTVKLLRAAVLPCVLYATACERHRPAGGPLALALEQCDPAGYFPCIQQWSTLSIPVASSGLVLTYSSHRDDSSAAGARDAKPLGLGGWSIDLLQRYDPKNHILVAGDGSWRVADAVPLSSGENAVPSFDGALAYVFDAEWRHVRTVDGHLGSVLLKIAYDAAGRVSRIDGSRDGQPVHLSVRRAGDGAAQSLVGADGATTALDLDGNGRLTSATDPAGRKTEISWGPNGRVVSLTDALGVVTRYGYDNTGGLQSITDADSVGWQFERDDLANGVEVRVTSTLGKRWIYRSESVGGGIRRTLVTPGGLTTTETVDQTSARTIKMADGTTLSIGAPTESVWGKAAPVLTPVVETRPDGMTSRREVQYALRREQGLPYALSGSVTTTVNGHAWVETFDPGKHIATLVDPVGRRTISTYDGDGHLLQRSAPGVPAVSYSYNADGRVTSETVGSSSGAGNTALSYDPSAGKIIVTHADGAVEKVGYDAAGQPVTASSGDGATATVAYNSAGRVNLIVPPGGAIFALGTSPAGRLTAFVPPPVAIDSSIETTSYDRDGDVTSITGLGNRAVNIVRDDAGRTTGLTFDMGKRAVSYDPRSGLITQAADPSGVTTAYGFAGRLPARLAWSGPVTGSVAETLDADGRSVAEIVNNAGKVTFTYDGSGALTSVGPLQLTRDSSSGLVTHSVTGVVETTQQYDGNSLLVRATTSATGKVLLDTRYTHDALGRITTVTETLDGKTTETGYTYDRARRLNSVRVNGQTVETESYDAAGNRTTVTRPTGTVKASYDPRNEALSWGSVRYDWAPQGNLVRQSDGPRALTLRYDDFGALREATLPDGRVIKYLVDAEGRRVGRMVAGKIVAGYLYRLDGSIAAELDSTGRVVAQFGYDDRGHLALVERGGVTYRVVTDPIGSPRLVIDSRNGAVAEETTYDVWGNAQRDAAPGFIPIGFAGGLRDPATGLIRFGARDYDPSTGRWTAADPLRFNGGDANVYRYAAGDPVNVVDRTGTFIPFIFPIFWAPFVGPAVTGGVIVGWGAGIGWGTGWAWDHFHEPSSNYGGSPPDGGNNSPNTGGNAPPRPPSNWNCASETGTCGSPESGNDPNHKPLWGCQMGACGMNNGHFSCQATICFGPDGYLCKAALGSQCSYGDTHFRTDDGGHLDFQAVGEFLAATSPDGNFTIQARQQAFSTTDQVSFNTAVAANVAGDRVGVYAREPSFLMVNGAAADAADFDLHLPHGGTVGRHGGSVAIGWPDGSQLTVVLLANTLNYGYVPSAALAPTLKGLLPNANAGPSKTLIGRDGASLALNDPAFATKLYQQFGNSWRIKPNESLFNYWPGEGNAGFTNQSFPTKVLTADSLAPAVRSRAEVACRAVGVRDEATLRDCILDVGVTGSFAMAAASVAAAGNPVQSAGPSTPSAPSTPTVASASTSPGVQDFAIKLGETVSPDHPTAGAGIITPSQKKQSYSFDARGGEIIYVQGGACDGAYPSFELHDAADHSLVGRGGCGDFGPVTLPGAGVYRIVVTSDQGSARYSFTPRATTFDKFSIKIGDTVSANRPAPGAGIIAQPGERQSYAFEGRAGQAIYVNATACEGAFPSFEIRDTANNSIGGRSGCGGVGPITLPSSGVYHLLVVSDQAAARYTVTLHATPFDVYPITLGDTVSPNRPAPGAGIIAQLGQRQAYSFDGRAGDAIYLQTGCQGSSLIFQVFKPDSSGLTGLINCGEGTRLELPSAGKYRILVRTESPSAQYSLAVWRIPPNQHFAVQLPLAVAPDAPARGAGRIAIVGAQQLFDFKTQPGTAVHIEQNCSVPCTNLVVRVTTSADTAGYSGFFPFMFIQKDWTLPAGNNYTIVVRSDGFTGTYGFKASLAGSHP